MSRIGGIGSLGGDQLRAIRRLRDLSKAINQNTQRLSTLKRINSAKDDPSGLIKATLLEQEISAAEASSRSITRASAILNTADSTAGEIVSQLQSARTLILAAADSTATSSTIAANQIQVDTILRNVDNLAQGEFNGRQLLSGASSFSTSSVDNTKITDVDVLDKQSADDVVVSVNVTSQATQATNSYTGGTLASSTTIIIEGRDGTETVTIASGSDTQAITDAINAKKATTGVIATKIDASQVDFKSADFGSKAKIKITATAGTFNTTTSGTVTGTDAIATINAQSVTGDGSTFNFNSSQVALVIEVDPTVSGSINSFTVQGEGLSFVIGSSPGSTARVGLPNLTTSSLGGVTGKLSSLISGGANTITGGKQAEALQIIDDAINDATVGRAVVGGFQKFTLDSSSRVLNKTIENSKSALSSIQDADVALESALLTRNQLLQSTTLEALAVSNLQGQGILNLIRNSTGLL